jgi:hypothetical protein
LVLAIVLGFAGIIAERAQIAESQDHDASTLRALVPRIGFVPDFSPEAQALCASGDEHLPSISTPEGKLFWEKCGDMSEGYRRDVWVVLSDACSWYCGGGPSQVSASSSLAAAAEITYEARNAHDFSFKTAWVEGAAGDGIGEYLEYRFDNESPRITEIIIHNGYVKSDTAWRSNSRVKKLKLTVNDEPFAVLNLEDTKAAQHFDMSPLGRRPDGKELVLRFEITEVYAGERHDDVAITELYFNGIDVH